MGKEIYKKVWSTRIVFALFFLLNRNRLCLLLLVCLFVFTCIPFVIAFSFLKMQTGVFPMKNLERTYIFFDPHRILFNYCSLQIEWHATDMCKHIILVSIDFKSIVSWILYAVIQFSPSNSKLDAIVFLESEIVINRVLKQPWYTKIRQCTNVDEFNRHITKDRCETRKLEPAQSTLAKLVKVLFEMERIFQEKDGKSVWTYLLFQFQREIC